MVGRLDDNGNIVPTSGRRGRLPQKDKDVASNVKTAELEETILRLKEENSRLKVRISELINVFIGHYDVVVFNQSARATLETV